MSGSRWSVRTARDRDSARCGGDAAAGASRRCKACACAAAKRSGSARSPAATVLYVAVEGGFDIAPVLGSVVDRHPRRHRRLAGPRARRRRPAAAPAARRPATAARFASKVSTVRPRPRVRVITGPQDDHFSDSEVAAFLDSEYTVGAERRPHGHAPRPAAPLRHSRGFDIASDGIAPGSIQVPGNGQPIVLLADRQTTGGYPKIATVISADLPALAGCRSAPRSRSRRSRIEAAEAARREHRRRARGDAGQDRAASPQRRRHRAAAARMQSHQRRRRRGGLMTMIPDACRLRDSRPTRRALQRPALLSMPGAPRRPESPPGLARRLRQAGRQCAARHPLDDRRDRAARGRGGDREMAGRDLSGRRGDVLPLALGAGRLRAAHPADDRLRGVRDQAAGRAYRARPVAVDLADLHRHRVQPDAARRRGRDQFLGAAVGGAALDPLAQGTRRARRAGRCC